MKGVIFIIVEAESIAEVKLLKLWVTRLISRLISFQQFHDYLGELLFTFR